MKKFFLVQSMERGKGSTLQNYLVSIRKGCTSDTFEKGFPIISSWLNCMTA